MKTLKRIAAVVATLALTVGMTANCFAASWEHYFGMDEKCKSVWYEGAECDGEPKTSADGWTAKLKSIGWGGIWGAQMKQKVTIKKGTEYQLKCTLKSTGCDKWVLIKIAKDEDFAYGKWIRLKKGQATTIDETFTATANADTITFGFGGEFGDRESTDGKVHYSYADGGMEAIAKTTDGDATYATTVSCSGYSLAEKTASNTNNNSDNNNTTQQNGGTTSTTGTTSTVATGDFTPIACGAAAVVAAAVIVVFARKREAE
ncbi:MAG: hypothetical protein ACLRZ9_01975 [Eubacterium sp.]